MKKATYTKWFRYIGLIVLFFVYVLYKQNAYQYNSVIVERLKKLEDTLYIDEMSYTDSSLAMLSKACKKYDIENPSIPLVGIASDYLIDIHEYEYLQLNYPHFYIVVADKKSSEECEKVVLWIEEGRKYETFTTKEYIDTLNGDVYWSGVNNHIQGIEFFMGEKYYSIQFKKNYSKEEILNVVLSFVPLYKENSEGGE